MRAIWSLAMLDLLHWRRTPFAIASAVIPPLAMALMLVVLSATVTEQPVALVVQSHGPNADHIRKLLETDTDAYMLTTTDDETAKRMLHDQQVAAIITIPPGFDASAAQQKAKLMLTLNNVDIDFADDIRRSVERSAAMYDAPQYGGEGDDDEGGKDAEPEAVSEAGAKNPYLIEIVGHDLRKTDVDFLHYQLLPALVLLVLNVGLMGTALFSARDAESGVARVVAASPMSPYAVITARLLGGFLASMAVLIPALTCCIAAGVVEPPLNHWPALAALFGATALCASGLGALLGSLLRGSRNVAMASSIVATYLFFLGGGFTTIAFLPQWLRNLSAFNPIRYAIDGMRQASFYPDLTGFPTDIVVLCGTAACSILLGSIAIRKSWR